MSNKTDFCVDRSKQLINTITVEIHHALDVFRFIASWNDEQSALPEYGEKILGNVQLKMDQLTKVIEDIAKLTANDDEELPF